MNLLANPLLLRAGFLLVGASAAFLIGLVMIRQLRKDLLSDGSLPSGAFSSADALPVQAYSLVIQQLKQQKQELAEQNLSDRRKAKTFESLSAAILANISCGVVLVESNGLIRQANGAAREILGFASPVGLHLGDVFRNATLRSAEGRLEANSSVEDVLAAAVAGGPAIHKLVLNYVAPNAESRVLDLTASPLGADDASAAGATLVLTDKTDFVRLHDDRLAEQEVSTKLAASLRESLAAIAGSAQQLARSRDQEMSRQLADGIAKRAAQLDRTLGNFLTGTEVSLSSAAGS